MAPTRRADNRIDLRLGLKDFGPIATGALEMKPLTLFVGPNNSGKSYAAMLLHSILESCPPIGRSVRDDTFPGGGWYRWRSLFHRTRISSDESKVNGLDLPRAGQEALVPQKVLNGVTRAVLKNTWERSLSDQITRSWASPLGELIRIGEETFRLSIGSGRYESALVFERGRDLKIKGYPHIALTFRVKALPSGAPGFQLKWDGGVAEMRELLRKQASESLKAVIAGRVASAAFEGMARPCYYLPAARSGILQGHRALAASIIRKAPYIGTVPLEIPRFSGVVADFISTILDLPEEKGQYYGLAQRLERELVKGEIVLRAPEADLPKEIKYRYRETEMALHRSSSTVSELAPLVLYLKYVVKPGSVLIIEEPEAHLHPANQRVMARFLVELVRNGVCVVITTHSEWLIEQLSNFVRLSTVGKQRRSAKYDYPADIFLRPDEVGAYVFEFDPRVGAHRIEKLGVDEDGIPEDEFVRVHEALYEETISIEKDMAKGRA